MSDAQAAESPERLPWIANENEADEHASRPRMGELGPWVLAALSAAALFLVLALAYWIAMHNWQVPGPERQQATPAETTAVPQAKKPVSPKTHAVRKHGTRSQRSPVPSVRLPEQRPVPLQLPRTKPAAKTPKVAVAKVQPTNELSPRTAAKAQRPAKAAQRQAPLPLPPSAYATSTPPSFLTSPFFASPQAQGRVVQIGAFKDMDQAKLWWAEMVRAYPQVGALQPSVVQSRYANGTFYYLFQIGTGSRANSLTLCQMMHQIKLGCAVTGLPWRATAW